MSKSAFLKELATARETLVDLCAQDRFAAAHLTLVASGHGVETHPGLWEYLARRAEAGGHAAVAHATRDQLRAAGWRNADLALAEARYYLDRQEHHNAAFLVRDAFGARPKDPAARLMLARCLLAEAQAARTGGPLRTDPLAVAELAEDLAPTTLTEALVLIDLLRSSGAFERALDAVSAARAEFGEDPRLATRAASIEEQRGRHAKALEIWEALAQTGPPKRARAARFRAMAAMERLDRHDEIVRHAAALVSQDLTDAEQMRLALIMSQHCVVRAIAARLTETGAAGASSDTAEIGDMLLDAGFIGLVQWMRRRRISIGDRAKRVLDQCGFGQVPDRPLPRSFAESAAILSPDFMLPVSDYLGRAAKPAGWPGEGRMPSRILLVNFSLAVGGAERQFVALVRALIAHGIAPGDLTVACFTLAADRGHDGFLPALEETGVVLHDLGTRRIANTTLPAQAARLIDGLPLPLRDDVRAVWHLAREIRPEALHGWQDKAALACGLAGQLLDLERVVCSFRNMSPRTRQDQDLARLRALYRDLAAQPQISLSVNAEAARTDYANWIGCAPARLNLLRNAVDMSQTPPAAARGAADADGPLRVTGVFRLTPNKRPELWLDTVAALARLSGRQVRPVIYGSGPLHDATEARAAHLGLETLDIIPGVRRPQDLYGDSDLVLLMSRVEGLPNVLLEAQACGVPVAACDVGGVGEAVHQARDGGGLLLPADVSPEAAARSIAAWFSNALHAARDRRRDFVASRFGTETLATRAAELYSGHRPSA